MSKTTLYAVTLVSLIAVSGAAQAGANISDKRYWPNETRTDSLTLSPGSRGTAAYAAEQRAPLNVTGSAPRTLYQGGPKSIAVPVPHW